MPQLELLKLRAVADGLSKGVCCRSVRLLLSTQAVRVHHTCGLWAVHQSGILHIIDCVQQLERSGKDRRARFAAMARTPVQADRCMHNDNTNTTPIMVQVEERTLRLLRLGTASASAAMLVLGGMAMNKYSSDEAIDNVSRIGCGKRKLWSLLQPGPTTNRCSWPLIVNKMAHISVSKCLLLLSSYSSCDCERVG